MEAQIVGQLGMEGGDQHVALARDHGVPVDLGEHLHPAPRMLDPGSADEHRAQRLVAEPSHRARPARSSRTWRPNALRRASMSIRPRCARSSMISPAHVPSTGRAGADHVPDRLLEAAGLELDVHRRALPAGDHEPVEPVELAGVAHLVGAGAEPLERGAVGLEVALHGEHADAGRESLVVSRREGSLRRYQPRCWSRLPSSSSFTSSPGIASPSASEASAIAFGSS